MLAELAGYPLVVSDGLGLSPLERAQPPAEQVGIETGGGWRTVLHKELVEVTERHEEVLVSGAKGASVGKELLELRREGSAKWWSRPPFHPPVSGASSATARRSSMASLQ
jgi:hypothetical protein